MPYFITDKGKDCAGWATVKADGEVIGCHATKAAAIKQMVAVSLAEKVKPGGERALNNELEVGDWVFWDNAGHTEYGLITFISTYGVVVDQLGATPVATQDAPLAKISVYEMVIDRLVGTDRFVVKPFAPLSKLEMPHDNSDHQEDMQHDENLNRAINQDAPAYMRAAARRGLQYVEEGKGGDGLKQQTINEARKMASGEVSDDKWVRIAAWIARHLDDLDSPEADPQHSNYPSAGVVAHLLWGSGPSKTKAKAAMNYAEGVVERIRNEERHLPGKHDQKSHGGGRVSGAVSKSILDRVKNFGGLSVKILSGNEPVAGYMVGDPRFGAIVSADDFYDETKITGILSDYLKKNKKELSGDDKYLGLWHNTKDGKVYLDVSQNILDRTEAIIAGQNNDQLSIWDVVKMEEIDTGGTGAIRTNQHDQDPGHFTNDGSRNRSTSGRVSEENFRTKREIAENILRHLPGKHDQKTHGGGKSIFKHASNSPETIGRLHTGYDPSVKSVYKAERIVAGEKIDYSTRPPAPKHKDFANDKEYLDAYKKYTEDHKNWGIEQLTSIKSDLGKENLDGTKKGIENYVNGVTNSDWFIEKFGTPHPELGKPKISLSNAKSYSGQVSLSRKNGNWNYQLKIDKSYVKNENTILHEIAHHAVHMSAKERYEGHGIDFRNAHIFIAENVAGKEYADMLRDAYKAEGLN